MKYIIVIAVFSLLAVLLTEIYYDTITSIQTFLRGDIDE